MTGLPAALLLVPALAIAQQSGWRAADPATARRVAERIAAAVEESYVFPDTGRMIADHLRARLRAGAYDAPMGGAQLADRLGADLRATNGDLHLYVTYGGQQTGALQNGARVVMRRPGEPPPADELLQARRANHNVRSATRLAGNVGYLDVGQLSARSDEALRVVDAAMAFLERADAMIIDVRRTPGGDPRMSDYLASYFFGLEPMRTLTSYSRAYDRTIERWTLRVSGRQRPEVPVYLLVGPGTASGAEDFAFIFKQTKRGTLVGERTAGAGRLTRMYPVGDGFTVSVPGGRTYDPRTGAEWERVGITPDVEARTDDALIVAHAAALETLARAASDSLWATSLVWTREGVLARARPARVSAGALARYAGTYDLRVIRFEEGKLWYQRDVNRPREELTPIDDHTFALGEASRVEFLREGSRVTGFALHLAPGQTAVFPRTR